MPLVQVLVSHFPFLQVLEDDEEFGLLITAVTVSLALPWELLIGSKLTVCLVMAEEFAGNTAFSVDCLDGNFCTGGPSYTESVS